MMELTVRSISIIPVEAFRHLEGKFPQLWLRVNVNIFSQPGTAWEFIIELRFRKYSLRRCQSPEEATLNVFRHHWDCRYPRALLLSSWRAEEHVSAQVHTSVSVCVCVFELACVCSCVHGFNKPTDPWNAICLHAVWSSRSWVWGALLSPTMFDKVLIQTPVYCLVLSTFPLEQFFEKIEVKTGH